MARLPYRTVLAILTILVIMQGCSLFSETPTQDAFVGGQIVNPLSDEIIISRNSRNVDTIKLNANNKFFYYIKNVKPGLYSFSHGQENQIMFLEPGDSTLLYANTINFDESLNFSGKGAEKNNFLIEMFLLNEKNNGYILSCATTEPEIMMQKTDSIRDSRHAYLRKLKERNNFSEEFMELAKTSIDYEYYDLRERYSYLINLHHPEFVDDFPEGFHSYRKKIDFNNPKLEKYYGYLRLIDNYLKNRSIEDCVKASNENCSQSFSFENIKRRMVLVDSLTQNQNLKKVYFCKLASQGILSSNKNEEIASVIHLLEEENFPAEKLQHFKMLGAIQQVYFPGKKVPSVKLTNAKNKEVMLPELVKKPTVFYNWSVYFSGHHKQVHELVAQLQLEYPEIDFVGLNVDPGDTENWLNVMKMNKYPTENEYQLSKVPIDKNLLRYFLDKILFVDKNGMVVLGDAKLNSPDFRNKLAQYLLPQKSGALAAAFLK